MQVKHRASHHHRADKTENIALEATYCHRSAHDTTGNSLREHAGNAHFKSQDMRGDTKLPLDGLRKLGKVAIVPMAVLKDA